MKKKTTLLTVILVFAFVQFTMAQQSVNPWQMVNKPSPSVKASANKWARTYTAYSTQLNDVRQQLALAPMQGSTTARDLSFVFYLPMPDGNFAAFNLVESPVMENGLAKAFPQIKTYLGKGLDDPTATLRCDVTPAGFHAMMLSAGGAVFVDPVDKYSTADYVSYYKKDALRQDFAQECLLHDDDEIGAKNPASIEAASISGTVRNYRLALACTGEYAAYHGGTVLGVLSAMVTTINRVNGVYERELGVHLNIIDNDTLLIFLNAASDPYSNNNGGTMLNQNQNTCDNLIGPANYDMGHVFSTGGGGIAGLGVICANGDKANGVTGLDTPIGDAFDIDYVAHEMGHQFGANHTFNSMVGACNGNRVQSAAYEPGSGSTIMAYAGICGNQDLQQHSDDYFHSKSFDEIYNYIHNDVGNTCPVVDSTANHVPVITLLPANFTIPMNTPFRLTAVAEDVDGDSLTYCWEEYDRGNSGNWNAPIGNMPIFRSFNPTVSGTRIFPKLANILSNTTTIGEIKPSYGRTLNFRCIIRDNNLDGAGVTYNPTTVKVYVSGASGPFAVSAPNTTGLAWVQGTTDSVNWLVSNSDLAPVNTPTVNVLLSLDGGYTWPIVLGSGVPNNGSFSFTVPVVSTTTARVMVEGAGNIFFDINDANFTISDGTGISGLSKGQSLSLAPNPTTGYFSILLDNNELGAYQLSITDLTGTLIQTQTVNKSAQQLSLDLDLSNVTTGIYVVRLQGTRNSYVSKVVKSW